jgi:hypothetical protein
MPPRRSGRSTARAHPALEEISAESATQDSIKHRKKQQKTQDADPPEIKKRSRGGKLRKLTEMPLDILFEV